MYSDMLQWRRSNAPPATMMIISNDVEEDFSDFLVLEQQETKYNLVLAYSFRPYKMSILVTSAEWLWDSLLAVSETRWGQGLRKCIVSACKSTGMCYCNSCSCDCKGLDDFRKHLSSEDHALKDASMYSYMRLYERDQEERIKDDYLLKRRRLRKA